MDICSAEHFTTMSEQRLPNILLIVFSFYGGIWVKLGVSFEPPTFPLGEWSPSCGLLCLPNLNRKWCHGAEAVRLGQGSNTLPGE